MQEMTGHNPFSSPQIMNPSAPEAAAHREVMPSPRAHRLPLSPQCSDVYTVHCCTHRLPAVGLPARVRGDIISPSVSQRKRAAHFSLSCCQKNRQQTKAYSLCRRIYFNTKINRNDRRNPSRGERCHARLRLPSSPGR